MTARLDRNLRRGHQAQGVGVILFRQFCAVADVPQTEDLGIDAFATLLRQEGRRLDADGTFAVQFKARSERTWPLDTDGYRWLRDLRVPLYVASVDVATNSVEVHTTHRLVTRPDADAYTSVRAFLDPVPEAGAKGVLHCGLGPPVLRWTYSEGETSEGRENAVRVLREWLRIEAEHRALRDTRYVREVRWATNEVPVVTQAVMMASDGDLNADFARAAPYFEKLALHYMTVPFDMLRGDDGAKEKLHEGILLYAWAKVLRDHGVRCSLDNYAGVVEYLVRERRLRLDLRLTMGVEEE